MKLIYKTLAASVLIASTGAMAQNPGDPATETGTASVTIWQLIQISSNNDMTFPATAAPNTGEPDEVHGSDDDGTFDLTGQMSQNYSFTAAAGTCTGAGLSIGNLAVSGDTAFDGSGNASNSVSADLTVTSAATAGTYSCNYTVTATYN